METLHIAVIGLSTFPCPSPAHTGDVVIVDLARTLEEMGHTVDFYAPEGSWVPRSGGLFGMPCSRGSDKPPMEWCEQTCLDDNRARILGADVVHDFSHKKRIAENLLSGGRKNVISTLLGGVWSHPNPPLNIVVWSEAMRQRGLRGATDYEGTPTPDLAGPSFQPILDAHVVPGGIDTDFYRPGPSKEDFFLWMNRWHPAKGYKVAIELARNTGIPLVMAGEHPDNERFEFQRNCALEAVRLADGLPNVRFEWLPNDPDHHTKKRDLYARAKALLYTVQFQEPFGLSQVEALACGTPVIGLNYGSVPEVIEDGVTGYVCENVVGYKDLRLACELFTEGSKHWSSTVHPSKCREEAVRRFDRRVMAEAYLREYRKILDGEIWGLLRHIL